MARRSFSVALVLLLTLGIGSARAGSRIVVLATATSAQDTGLLDLLVPLFERTTGLTVRTIAVGTGQALAMVARGEADVALTHFPELELRHLAEGGVAGRRPVMYNYFVMVGPPHDPVGIKGLRSAAEAFRKVAERGAIFVSRADQSGTHQKELALWKAADVTPKGKWYIESGQGQGAALTLASEKGAYALTDRGTYLVFQKRLQLALLVEGNHSLMNPYHVTQVNLLRRPRANAEGGRALAEFLVSPNAQGIIKTFGIEKYGAPLFFPAAALRQQR